MIAVIEREKPPRRRVLVEAVVNPESSEGFPNGCWNRVVFGAISKVLWESCVKVRVFESAFHNCSIAPSPVAASTGHFSFKNAQQGEEKEDIGELSGNIQGEDGIEDEWSWRHQCECTVGGSRNFSDVAIEMASRSGWS
jgi:hypothetical protein